MKTFFALAAALLLCVPLLSAFLPGEVLAAESKVSAEEMSAVKKTADEAAQAVKLLVEQAKTEEGKSLAKELLEYAEANAAAAADPKQAEPCAAIAKAVNEAAAVIAAGDAGKAGELLDKIAEMTDGLPKSNKVIGEVTSIDMGKIYAIDRNGSKRQLQRSSAVHEGETVKTEGEKSVSVILMRDGAQWDISGESEIELPEYHSRAINSNHCDSTTIYIIKKGLIVYNEKHAGKECTYIKVREKEVCLTGTKIEIDVQEDGSTNIIILDGSVTIDGKTYNAGEKIVIDKGDGYTITGDSAEGSWKDFPDGLTIEGDVKISISKK